VLLCLPQAKGGLLFNPVAPALPGENLYTRKSEEQGLSIVLSCLPSDDLLIARKTS
jgi:hypothetical protein